MTFLESKFYDHMNFDTVQDSMLSSIYLDFFSKANYILEIAPGRGEFMRRMQKEGKRVLGVDIDEGMVDEAMSKGLNVILDDALSFLSKTEEKFDGIFCAHFIEHLTADQLIELLKLCHQALASKGILVIVTPNPASLQIQLNEFWRDATHIRPYNLELLHFLFEYSGFEILESGGNPSRIYQVVGSPLIKPEADYEEPNRFPKFIIVIRRTIANFLVKAALGPKFNRINDRIRLLEHAVKNMYPSNEIYIVGKCPD